MDNTPGDKLGVWQDMRLADALVLLLVTAASDLLVHKILLNSVLLSPIVSGGVRPKLPDKLVQFCNLNFFDNFRSLLPYISETTENLGTQ